MPALRLLPDYFQQTFFTWKHLLSLTPHLLAFIQFLSCTFSSDLLWESVFCPQTPKECTAATNFLCACLHHALFPWSLTAAVHSKHRNVGYPTIFPPCVSSTVIIRINSGGGIEITAERLPLHRKLWQCSFFSGTECTEVVKVNAQCATDLGEENNCCISDRPQIKCRHFSSILNPADTNKLPSSSCDEDGSEFQRNSQNYQRIFELIEQLICSW